MSRPLAGFAAVNIGDLHPAPGNPRTQLRNIRELALSLHQSGMLQPIVAQAVPGEPGYRIIAGHRRHAAARNLGWATVPVIVRRDMLPDDELVAMLAENGQREPLDPIEEAHAYRRLLGQGVAQRDIGARVGRSIAHVSTRLALLELPVEDQEQIRAGVRTISEGIDRSREQRVATGQAKPRGTLTRGWYFDRTHPLAEQARARCLEHARAGRKVAGGIACGSCWEQTIRDHERANAGAGAAS